MGAGMAMKLWTRYLLLGSLALLMGCSTGSENTLQSSDTNLIRRETLQGFWTALKARNAPPPVPLRQ